MHGAGFWWCSAAPSRWHSAAIDPGPAGERGAVLVRAQTASLSILTASLPSLKTKEDTMWECNQLHFVWRVNRCQLQNYLMTSNLCQCEFWSFALVWDSQSRADVWELYSLNSGSANAIHRRTWTVTSSDSHTDRGKSSWMEIIIQLYTNNEALMPGSSKLLPRIHYFKDECSLHQ